MKTTLLVNWYKPSGKWYSSCKLDVPDEITVVDLATTDVLKNFVELNQTELGERWVEGQWYVSVSCIEQPKEDVRFFERMFKYNL